MTRLRENKFRELIKLNDTSNLEVIAVVQVFHKFKLYILKTLHHHNKGINVYCQYALIYYSKEID